MKKLLILLTLFFFSANAIHADEQHKVKLEDGHTKELVRLGYCNIFVTRVDVDDESVSKVSVEIENLDESNVIILFGHAYPEKELKKLSPSITFDKNFPGTKGKRNIDTYREARNVLFIEPSEKCMLPTIHIKDSETQSCRLPFYIAKYKKKGILNGSNGRNKLLLMEKQILELEIEVEVKPDENFIRLDKETNDLIKELSKKTFCRNSSHRPSLIKQEDPYKKKITDLKTEIKEIITSHNWGASDKRYQEYKEIEQRLDSIDLSNNEGDCGKHRSRHSCKYCNLSLQQIYHKLDDYFKKIYNSSNRKAAKESVMSDINLLYKCCTDGNCNKHASAWKKSEYKSKITDCYNRISNF